MKIWFAPYTLRSRAPLGGHARARDRHGALLCVEAPGGDSGYADLHPWPELGDFPLERQLGTLRDGRRTAQVERSLRLAALDADARQAGRSLFEGLDVPPSHRLIADPTGFDAGTVADGITHLKVKVGADWAREVDAIARLDAALGGRVRWRLDANAMLSADRLAEGLARLRACVGEARWPSLIDFVEDPCPFDAAHWRGLRTDVGVGIALDRETGGSDHPETWTHLVIKPAVQDPGPLARRAVAAGRRLVVTSYLDHPVGQMHAAASAARLAREHGVAMDVCGLLSHSAYEPTAYGEAIVTRGPRLVPGDGAGVGFEDLLRKEPWRRLG